MTHGPLKVGLSLLYWDNWSGTGFYTRRIAESLSRLSGQGIEGIGLYSGNQETPRDVPIAIRPVSETSLRWPFRLGASFFGRPATRGLDRIHYPAGIGPPRTDIPVIATVHDVSPFLYPDSFPPSRVYYLRMILAAVVRTAHTLLADTRWQASKILTVFPAAESKLHVVPIPCDPCFGPLLPSEVAPVERPYILSVGTLEPRKNIDRLITAWKDSGLDLDLVLAGRWGWKFESLKKVLTDLTEIPQQSGCECWELPDGRHITRYQFLDGAVLRNLYQRAACLVYPSLFEGFGLPVLEAMTCGCPVLTSSESAMAEVAGESGWYFDPLDTRSISRTIEEVLSRRTERNRRIGLGLERARTFSSERLAEDLLRVYQD